MLLTKVPVCEKYVRNSIYDRQVLPPELLNIEFLVQPEFHVYIFSHGNGQTNKKISHNYLNFFFTLFY